ncbi:MAG: CAP domain-containing protein [Pararhodobacter sp.]|nr:CAP domain-containing protein [Pararhodobacter sp.]
MLLPALWIGLFLTTGTAWACTIPREAPALREAVRHLANAERSQAGLAPLSASRRITLAAQGHACSIARRDTVTHRGALGGGLRIRLLRVGYTLAAANENLAMGLDTPGAAVAGWMGSPGHRRNILAPDMRDVGTGIAVARDGRLIWVMISARSR